MTEKEAKALRRGDRLHWNGHLVAFERRGTRTGTLVFRILETSGVWEAGDRVRAALGELTLPNALDRLADRL